MEGKARIIIAPILVIVMLIFSSLIMMGGGASDIQNTELRNGVGSAGKILFIYDNKTLADEWNDYLTGMSYGVNFLPADMIRNVNYNLYDLVIIGMDHSALLYEDVMSMNRSHVPIMGVGYGSVYAGIYLTPAKYYVYTSMGSPSHDVKALKNLSMYKTPYSVSGIPGDIQIFNVEAPNLFVADTTTYTKGAGLSIGYSSTNPAYATIMQFDNYLFFGYTQSPATLTTDGSSILANLIYYMASNNNYNVGIPKVMNRITLDGTLDLFEWFGAKFVTVDGTWNNYVALFEDENYLYVAIHIENTSDTNEFMTVWFEKDNNRTSEAADTSVFYIGMYENAASVNYREVIAYNTWGSFHAPDGTNIAGAADFSSSDYLTAEFRISKSYLGITPTTSHTMGFGIQYRVNNYVRNYPSTFFWKKANTAITVYSENHWKGQMEYVNAPRWDNIYGIIIDGDFSANEWYGAEKYWVPTIGNYFYIAFSHNDDNLLIGGYMKNISGKSSSLYFYFDPAGNGGTAPQTDDFEIWGGKTSSDLLFQYEHYGTGSNWGSSQALTHANIEFSMKGNYLYFEMNISFSKLGINSNTWKDIKMQIATNMAGEAYHIPTGAQHTVPDTWNLTLYSQDLWSTDQMAFDAREGSAVTLDGTLDSGEWDDAFYTYFPTAMGKNVGVYMKTYNNHLYMALRYYHPNSSSETNIQIGFDVGYDHGGGIHNEDFVIMITHTGSAREFKGNATSGWWDEVTPSDWSLAMNTSGYWTIEISINYSKLDVTPGIDSNLGILFFIKDYTVGSTYSPEVGNFMNTDGWHTITTSDNWGETVIPEFGTFAMIGIVGVVAALAILRRRKH